VFADKNQCPERTPDKFVFRCPFRLRDAQKRRYGATAAGQNYFADCSSHFVAG
jgi:hypothetical protein